MANYMAYNVAMKAANIAEFKNRLSFYISLVEKGEKIEIRNRNVPVAQLIPIIRKGENSTVLGCGKETVHFTEDDLTAPLIPEESWEMHS